MPSGPSPTERTLEHFRNEGWFIDVSEKWIRSPGMPGGGYRKDLFGFMDMVAMKPGEGIMAIQATSGANTSSRINKIKRECHLAARAWLEAGGRIQVWGWKYYLKEKEGLHWRSKVTEVEEADLR